MTKTSENIRKVNETRIKGIEKNTKLNFVKGPLINQHSYDVSTEKLEKTGFTITNRIEDSIRNIMNSLKFGE